MESPHLQATLDFLPNERRCASFEVDRQKFEEIPYFPISLEKIAHVLEIMLAIFPSNLAIYQLDELKHPGKIHAKALKLLMCRNFTQTPQGIDSLIGEKESNFPRRTSRVGLTELFIKPEILLLDVEATST